VSTVIVNGRKLEDLSAEERARFEARGKARLADMFAAGKPPRGRTDATFLEGHHNGNQFEGEERVGDIYRKVAEAHGQNTTGKVYLPALAEFPGDPHAWVSGRGDVQRRCEEKGWECEGAVTVKGRQFEHKKVPVAEDIVQREVARELAADPTQDAGEVRHTVIKKRRGIY